MFSTAKPVRCWNSWIMRIEGVEHSQFICPQLSIKWLLTPPHYTRRAWQCLALQAPKQSKKWSQIAGPHWVPHCTRNDIWHAWPTWFGDINAGIKKAWYGKYHWYKHAPYFVRKSAANMSSYKYIQWLSFKVCGRVRKDIKTYFLQHHTYHYIT